MIHKPEIGTSDSHISNLEVSCFTSDGDEKSKSHSILLDIFCSEYLNPLS